MRASTIGLIAATVATVASGSACAIIFGLFAPGASPLRWLFPLSPVVTVMMIFIVLVMIGAIVAGLIGLLVTRRPERGPGGVEGLLRVATGVCTVFGVLAVLYGEFHSNIALQKVGPVSLTVAALSRIETLFSLTICLAGVTLALAFLAGNVNRRMDPRPKH